MPGNIDLSQLVAGLARWGQAFAEKFGEGLGQAGGMLLNDSVQETPTVPLRFGHLRGSGSVFVQGKLVSTSAGLSSGGTPATADDTPLDPVTITCVVGFNTVYAAPLHEGRWVSGPLAGVTIRNYREPGSGAFYLLRKLEAHGRDYVQWAVDYARAQLGM